MKLVPFNMAAIMAVFFVMDARASSLEFRQYSQRAYDVVSTAGYQPEMIEAVRVEELYYKHALLGRGHVIGRAVRYDDGHQEILMREGMSERQKLGILLHEVSHILAWTLHGTDVAPHGRDFNNICWKLVSAASLGRHFCRPD